MKLLSFEHQGRPSWGAVMGEYVADLGRAYPQYPTLQAYIAAGRTLQAGIDAASVAADIPLSAIRFLPDGGATGGSIDIVRPSGAGVRLRVDWLSGQVLQEPLSP